MWSSSVSCRILFWKSGKYWPAETSRMNGVGERPPIPRDTTFSSLLRFIGLQEPLFSWHIIPQNLTFPFPSRGSWACKHHDFHQLKIGSMSPKHPNNPPLLLMFLKYNPKDNCPFIIFKLCSRSLFKFPWNPSTKQRLCGVPEYTMSGDTG